MHNRIDEWLVAHLNEFEGKQLQSVAKGDVNLDEIETKVDKEEHKKQEEEIKSEFDPLIKRGELP